MAKKILIADDEHDVLELVTDILVAAGYDVVCAADGQEALERIAQEKPDLILLDIRMPIMDGIETCRRIKEDTTLEKIPILFVSANSKGMSPEVFDLTKAQGYIRKPFEASFLLQKVKELLL
jgi:two-component system alkaline phosphatase synthesis response regulator PhoP